MRWQIRIGIHSGEIGGGVVGVKKYIHDMFGGAVNTAGRMKKSLRPNENKRFRVNSMLSKMNFTLLRERQGQNVNVLCG